MTENNVARTDSEPVILLLPDNDTGDAGADSASDTGTAHLEHSKDIQYYVVGFTNFTLFLKSVNWHIFFRLNAYV